MRHRRAQRGAPTAPFCCMARILSSQSSLAPLLLALFARPLPRADVPLLGGDERAGASRGAPVDSIGEAQPGLDDVVHEVVWDVVVVTWRWIRRPRRLACKGDDDRIAPYAGAPEPDLHQATLMRRCRTASARPSRSEARPAPSSERFEMRELGARQAPRAPGRSDEPAIGECPARHWFHPSSPAFAGATPDVHERARAASALALERATIGSSASRCWTDQTGMGRRRVARAQRAAVRHEHGDARRAPHPVTDSEASRSRRTRSSAFQAVSSEVTPSSETATTDPSALRSTENVASDPSGASSRAGVRTALATAPPGRSPARCRAPSAPAATRPRLASGPGMIQRPLQKRGPNPTSGDSESIQRQAFLRRRIAGGRVGLRWRRRFGAPRAPSSAARRCTAAELGPRRAAANPAGGSGPAHSPPALAGRQAPGRAGRARTARSRPHRRARPTAGSSVRVERRARGARHETPTLRRSRT